MSRPDYPGAILSLCVLAGLGRAQTPCGLVYVANSSGDFRTTTAALVRAAAEEGTPLCVETFVWTHGFGRYVLDHVDHDNLCAQGRRLAETVLAARQGCPGRPVYLVGHSAGCAVVLYAAELLPPDTFERIILLAPTVSPGYDLRPALTASRQGVDAFVSRRDVFTGGLAMRVVGTADRQWAPAAGQVGFCPVLTRPGDERLYGKLRQHDWDPCVQWTGNLGLHFGWNRVEYTRAYLLPLLRPGPTCRPAIALRIPVFP